MDTNNPMPEFTTQDLLKWCVNDPEQVQKFIDWVKGFIRQTSEEIIRNNTWEMDAYGETDQLPIPARFIDWIDKEWLNWARQHKDISRWGRNGEIEMD